MLGVGSIKSPLIPSLYLSEAAGCNVWLKLDNAQPSGSFKSRGLSHVVATRAKNAKPGTKLHFYSSSGGNAGLAAAYACRSYGQMCTVVVPTLTKPQMIERIKLTGAEVVIHGDMWVEADAYLRDVLMKQVPEGVEAVYLHPFEGRELWEGHSFMIDEIVEQLPEGAKMEAIAISVGGGGLYSGVVTGLMRNGLNDVQVVAVETEGSNCFHESLKAGKQVVLKKLNSIATSLGSTYVPLETLELAKQHPTKSVLVSDADCMRACVAFADDHKAIVEPACGATLALGYANKLKEALPDLKPDSHVVLLVCGGNSTTAEGLAEYRQQLEQTC